MPLTASEIRSYAEWVLEEEYRRAVREKGQRQRTREKRVVEELAWRVVHRIAVGVDPGSKN